MGVGARRIRFEAPTSIKRWFNDQHFRSLLKNSSYLAASRVIAALRRAPRSRK